MILTKKFSSSKTLAAYLEQPDERFEITYIDRLNCTIRCNLKPISSMPSTEEQF